MKQILIIIEKTIDHYSAYADNVDGIYGGGDTPEEAKKSIVDAIRPQKTQTRTKKEDRKGPSSIGQRIISYRTLTTLFQKRQHRLRHLRRLKNIIVRSIRNNRLC